MFLANLTLKVSVFLLMSVRPTGLLRRDVAVRKLINSYEYEVAGPTEFGGSVCSCESSISDVIIVSWAARPS